MTSSFARMSLAVLVVGLLVFALHPGVFALPPELWVVNEASRDISIIDDIADTPATIETIPLGGATDPSPYGIAFSTLSAQPGGHAFVTQGGALRLIEHATRQILATCDVAIWLGVEAVDLKGADSARPELFRNDVSGLLVERSYLHVAANVRPAASDDLAPWYLVFDQSLLIGGAATCANAVVGAGPLMDILAAPAEAMEVRVLGSPAGERRQRAWYTIREFTDPQALLTALVAGGPALDSPWRIAERSRFPLAPGDILPDSIHPGAPHSRDLPLVPLGPSGELVNLETGRRCPLGETPRALAVTGPGLGSYDIWTAKSGAGGGPGFLQRTHWESCDAEPPLQVGRDPVDVETLGRVEWQEVYVANRGSDTVSVVQEDAPGLVIHIELLDDPGPGPCQKCPRSLAVQERPESICRAINYREELINAKTEILHTWDGIGCLDLETFKMWCRCLASDPLDCPSWCTPGHAPVNRSVDGFRTGEIWVEVDIIGGNGSGGGQKTTPNEGEATVQTNVEPNDKPAG